MKRLILFLILTPLAIVFGASWLAAGEAAALDNSKCLTCHGIKDMTKTKPDGRKISLYVSEQMVNTAAHRFIDCTTCHGAEPHKLEMPLTKQTLAEKCGTCHQYEYQLHATSVHGKQLQAGNQDVATCTDCHSVDGSPHAVMRVLEYKAPTYKKNIADTCGNCHNREKLMASYGIVEQVYESYMRSFHGKAMEGTENVAALNTATCTNCHGFHDIKATDDPTSPVAGLDNLARTCEQCHEGGGVNFARSFLGHKEATPQNVAPVYYTQIGFTIFLLSVVALGFVILIAGIVGVVSGRWKWRD